MDRAEVNQDPQQDVYFLIKVAKRTIEEAVKRRNIGDDEEEARIINNLTKKLKFSAEGELIPSLNVCTTSFTLSKVMADVNDAMKKAVARGGSVPPDYLASDTDLEVLRNRDLTKQTEEPGD